MSFILFDEPTVRSTLLPLTYTRPVAKLRVGVFTIEEKWRYYGSCGVLAAGYLRELFPLVPVNDPVYVNGALCPDPALVSAIGDLSEGDALYSGERLLAFRSSGDPEDIITDPGRLARREYPADPAFIDRPWKIFQNNGSQLRSDIERLRNERDWQGIPDPHTVVYGGADVIVGRNVTVKSAVIDAENGPVYIADHCVIAPGSVIRGPFAMLEGAELNMGARMRGDITIGPYCKVGGEVSNSVFFGYSNKAHDGFLGNSIVGEWCNLGADTNTSNMKNDYSEVKVWNYASGRFERTGSMFCGLVMGDHSKAGINVMFNSGTSVGVSSSIYNANYPRNFIPSFIKGGASGWENMGLKEASTVASRVMERREREFGEAEARLFEKVFELSAQYRRN